MPLYVTLELNFNFFNWNIAALGLPWWLRVKESACQCRSCGFNPWVRKISWRRKWKPNLVFLPEKSHEQSSLACYSPWGLRELDMTSWLNNNKWLLYNVVLVSAVWQNKSATCIHISPLPWTSFLFRSSQSTQ